MAGCFYCSGVMVWKDNKPIVFVSLSCPPVGPHRMDAVTDDRFQIASSAEGKRLTGRLRWPVVGVSGITIPARVRPSVVSAAVMGKNESGDCLPKVALPLPPHPPFVPFFCEEEVGLVPRHPSPPADLLFEYSSSGEWIKIQGRVFGSSECAFLHENYERESSLFTQPRRQLLCFPVWV